MYHSTYDAYVASCTYTFKSLSITKHARKFKPSENSKIGVLSEMSSWVRYSQEDIEKFRFIC